MSTVRSVLSSVFTWTFFGGVCAGLVLGLVGLIGFARYDMRQSDREEAREADLNAPPIPTETRMVTYGTVAADWTLHSATEPDSTTFGALDGGPVLVNRWATWCAPCRVEMPTLQALHDSTGEDLRLAVVSEEPRDHVQQYIQNAGYSMPVYVVDDIPSALEGTSVPRTYVVRPDGQVVYRHDGTADWNSQAVYRFLERVRRPPS
jgi:thiol-disulfide isomerase/thioredoxin